VGSLSLTLRADALPRFLNSISASSSSSPAQRRLSSFSPLSATMLEPPLRRRPPHEGGAPPAAEGQVPTWGWDQSSLDEGGEHSAQRRHAPPARYGRPEQLFTHQTSFLAPNLLQCLCLAVPTSEAGVV